MRDVMRIRERQSFNGYDVTEREPSVSLVKNQQTFYSLFQSPSHSEAGEEEGSEKISMDRQRQAACFGAMMRGENARYQDANVSIQQTGEGQLCWRLLTGAMKGCTLYVRWRCRHISIEISAPAMLAKRLLKLQKEIEQHIAQHAEQYLVDIKITGETGYV